MKRYITEKQLEKYKNYLQEEEKSSATIQKYICDLKKLLVYMGEQEITKKKVIEYKEMLKTKKEYKLSSINSFLVAANRFFEYMGWYELRVKTFRIQREAFIPEDRNLTKEEYKKMVQLANKKGKTRLALILETICATGIRISELTEITVTSVKRGVADIYCKGKARQILMPQMLQKKLLCYIKQQGIKQGVVFRTMNGKPVNRSNIWREMKALGKEIGIQKEKVRPHNLRHLFAKVFYQIEKDIAKLADVLGHSNIETTRIYIKTTSCEHRRQLESMELVMDMQTNTT